MDDKVKVVGKGEFAKCLLVCGTIANISKVIDVNISSSSSSSKSNTHNALKMMRKAVDKCIGFGVLHLWRKHFYHTGAGMSCKGWANGAIWVAL